MKIYYEREKIFDYIGEDGAKLRFGQFNDVDVNFAPKYTQFFCSGIFQVPGGPALMVLPWFLKGHINLVDGNISKSELIFFDLIKKIKYFIDSSIELKNNGENGLAFEIICHSFLKKSETFIKEIIKNNFFVDVEESSNSIKGKWNISADLKKGPRPLKFNCSFSSVNKNIKELAILKGTVKALKCRLKSRHNIALCNSILRLLFEVIEIPVTNQTLLRLNSGQNALTRHIDWPFIYEFIYNLFNNLSEKSVLAGISYKLPVDKFFEDVLRYLIEKVPGNKIGSQKRKDILGGSSWVSSDGLYLDDSNSEKARTYSIPDFTITNNNYYCVVECKYKPLRINFLNSKSTEVLSSFGRDDRNQLLSFALSVQPNLEMKNRKVVFNVVFPSVDVESIKLAALSFPYSKFSFNNFSKNITQRNFKDEVGSSNILRFNFVAINLAVALEYIKKGKAIEFGTELINQFTTRHMEVVKPAIISTSDIERKIQKRLALASLIVQELPHDRTLGRTKMAKILFLSDSMFNLDLGMNYMRAAAGPLDLDAIVNEKIGIEALADKNSFFKTKRTKKDEYENDRYNYSPSVNIKTARMLAENVLHESLEAIVSLIKLMKSLNTEQSEIVATLYGCWNDLLINNKFPTDDQIIGDFLENWHQSKKRFSDTPEVLHKWLAWMRRYNIIPIGEKILTYKVAS